MVNNNTQVPTPYQRQEHITNSALQMGRHVLGYGFTSDTTAAFTSIAIAKTVNQGKPPDNMIRKGNIIANLLKVALYIPIIGQIIAIAGLVLLKRGEKELIREGGDVKELHRLTSHLKARLILSAIGLGAVYLPLDVAFSGVHAGKTSRLKKESKAAEKEYEELERARTDCRKISDKFHEVQGNKEELETLLANVRLAEDAVKSYWAKHLFYRPYIRLIERELAQPS